METRQAQPFLWVALVFAGVLLTAIYSPAQVPPGFFPRSSAFLTKPPVPESPLFDAVAARDLVRVRQLLQNHPELVNVESKTKEFWGPSLPLEEALTVRSETFTDISLTPISKQHAAQVAKAQDQKAIAALLLDHGARIHPDREQGSFNGFSYGARTALQYAVMNGSPELAALLLDRGADISVQDANGQTALQEAVWYGQLPMVNLLLARGAKINQKTRSGATLLEMAMTGKGCLNFPDTGLAVVQTLLDHGADVNLLDERGRTALAAALEEGGPKTAQAILAHGIDLHAKTSTGETPLTLVLAAGWTNVLPQVLDTTEINDEDKQGIMPLHWAVRHASQPQPYLPVADSSKESAEWLRVVRLLLDKGADINAADNTGLTPIFYTLLHRDRATYDLLLQYGAKRDALAALFEAAARNDVSKLAQGAADNTALTELRASTGATLLHVAALWGAADTTRFLLRLGADPNARDANALAPLHYACRFRGNEPAVKLLLMRGADPNLTAQESSPLIEALDTKSLEMVRLLLNAGGGPHPLDSLLLPAVRTQSAPLVRLLFDHGAVFVKPKKGQENHSLLLEAIDHNAGPDMVRLLLDRGVDVNPDTPDQISPLVDAAQKGQVAVVQSLLEHRVGTQEQRGKALIAAAKFDYPDLVQLLLNLGTDINSRDVYGQTALMNAVSMPYDQNPFDQITRLSAVPAVMEDTVPFLLDHGADVNAASLDGRTALMEASRRGCLEAVMLLLKKGASVHARSRTEETALRAAHRSGNKAIIALLQQAGAKE